MKHIKHILCGVLFSLMLLAGSVPVLAKETVIATDVNVSKDAVTVTVKANKGTDLTSGRVLVSYDKKLLTLTSVKESSDWDMEDVNKAYEKEDGKGVSIAWASADATNAGGTIATLTFVPVDGANGTNTEIHTQVKELYASNTALAEVGNTISDTVKAGEAKVTGIKLSKKSVTLVKGKTTTLKATITPADAKTTVTWSSSDKKIATVDKNGKVKAIKGGTATITAKTANGLKATCKVTVASVEFNAKSTVIQVGKSSSAVKIASKSISSDKVKSYKSSNTKIVTVDSKGKIKGKKVGEAKITVTMKSGATASYKVKVQKDAVKTKSLSVSSSKVSLKKGKSTTVTVTRNPISATEKLTWKSSDKKVATVNSKGKIVAKGKGTATITVTSSNGKKATIKVTVK